MKRQKYMVKAEKELSRFYYKKSRLQQLKGFCYTYQEGTVTKAAERMGLLPTAVTMQIKSLEDVLGVKLFTKIKNRLKPTEDGKMFYEMAIIQLQGIDSLFNNFYKSKKERQINKLIIAGYYTSLTYIFPKYVKKFTEQEEFKDVEITFCNICKEEALKRLINNEIDFAFYPSTEDSTKEPVEILKEDIFRLKNAVFIHKDHPLAKKNKINRSDIEEHDFILKDKYDFVDPYAIFNLTPSRIKFENASSNIILGFIKQNLGFGVCGELFYDSDNNIKQNNLLYKNIDHLIPKMFYSLFTLKNKQMKKSALFFINELKKNSDLI